MQPQYSITVRLKHANEPDTFNQVVESELVSSFLRIQTLYTTFFIHQEEILEFSVKEVDYTMTLNYTPAEWRAEVTRTKRAADDAKMTSMKATVVAAINNGAETALVEDDQLMIDKTNESLKADGFQIHPIGNQDAAGNITVRIREFEE